MGLLGPRYGAPGDVARLGVHRLRRAHARSVSTDENPVPRASLLLPPQLRVGDRRARRARSHAAPVRRSRGVDGRRRDGRAAGGARTRRLTVGWTPGASRARGTTWRASCGSASTTCASSIRHMRRRRGSAAAPRSGRRAVVRWLAACPLLRTHRRTARCSAWVLRQFEQAVAAQPRGRRDFLREQAPDVVLITPLVDLGSPQLDHFTCGARPRAAHGACASAAGITCRASRCSAPCPTCVTVWNETQKQEAVELHGVPPDRVVVTGAQCYDQWFGRRAVAVARGVLRAASASTRRSRFVLYVCSSLFREHGQRGGIRASSGSQARARQRRPAAARGRHPGQAAPGAPRRVAARPI